MSLIKAGVISVLPSRAVHGSPALPDLLGQGSNVLIFDFGGSDVSPTHGDRLLLFGTFPLPKVPSFRKKIKKTRLNTFIHSAAHDNLEGYPVLTDFMRFASLPRIPFYSIFGPVLAGLLFILTVLPVEAQSFRATAVDPLTLITPDWTESRPGAQEKVRLLVPRNGTASGPVVVEASPSDLARVTCRITAAPNVDLDPAWLSVRYGSRNMGKTNPQANDYDALWEENPRPEENFLPLWITVKVPVGVEPGTYRGNIEVVAGSGRQSIPLEVEVYGFTMPDPLDTMTWVGLYQSPEAIAGMYDVPIWSEEHIELMRPSFQMMRRVGQRHLTLYILIDQYIGTIGTIPFVERGGRLEPDYSFARRYMELFNEEVGELEALTVVIWTTRLYYEGGRDGSLPEKMEVATLNPDGSMGMKHIPTYGPDATKSFWSGVFMDIKEMVREIGWDNTLLTIGTAGDIRPSEEVVAYFEEVAPDYSWYFLTHGRGDPPEKNQEDEIMEIGGIRAGLYMSPFGPFRGVSSDKPPILRGWDHAFRRISTARFGFLTRTQELINFRTAAEGTVEGWQWQDSRRGWNWRGLSGMGIDFWRYDAPWGRIDGIWQVGGGSYWPRMHTNNTAALSAAGPEGALETTRFEMLVEGIQETEARITIERVLVDTSLRRMLPSGVAQEAEEFLLRRTNLRMEKFRENGPRGAFWGNPNGAYEITNQLFQYASKAQKILVREHLVTLPEPTRPVFREELARDWTSADGRTIRAEYLRYEESGLVLRLPDNREVILPLGRLSRADQQWVREESGFRVWRNQAGVEIEARLIDQSGSEIEIERLDGRRFQLPIHLLSEEDVHFLQEKE